MGFNSVSQIQTSSKTPHQHYSLFNISGSFQLISSTGSSHGNNFSVLLNYALSDLLCDEIDNILDQGFKYELYILSGGLRVSIPG